MYKHLQNGSDIRGVALAQESSNITLTPQAVSCIGTGFVRFISERFGLQSPRIAIGHDSRITGKDLFLALAKGLSAARAQVVYTGLCSTPAMFMSTIMPEHMYDASIMITASHMPYDRNGLKFFTKDGGLDKPDIRLILEYAAELDANECTSSPVRFDCINIMEDYSDTLRQIIIDGAGMGNMPLEGLHIVIDAGHGAGGFFETCVLQPLGANTAGSVCTRPDGKFPTHSPNPEDNEAMRHISAAVLEANADLGIIFDADADRAAVVFSDGKPVNRNRLIALMSAIVLKKHPGSVIVTDSVTSTGLAEFIAARGGIHRRFKRGYRNVINEAKRLNANGIQACLAIETSGHGALKEGYFLDDGAYMAAVILAELASLKKTGSGGLEGLIAELKEPAESLECRISIKRNDFSEYAHTVISELEHEVAAWDGYSIEPESFEGLRANADAKHGDGWFLLRASLHDPVLVLNIESNTKNGIIIIKNRLFKALSAFNGLHLDNNTY